MTRKSAIVSVCLALGAIAALPGTAVAGSGTEAAKSGSSSLVISLTSKACAGERQQIGKRAFRKRYGAGKRAAKACSRRLRKQARDAVFEATAECQAELEDYGEEDFYLDWDSFSDCVVDYADWVMGGGSFEDDGSGNGGDEDGLPLQPLSAART
jgi:hypothetical protein